MITIHGDRMCPVCKGFCYKGSWRTTWGKRRRYYCSLAHILYKEPYWTSDGKNVDSFLVNTFHKLYERVDVIPKRSRRDKKV